MADLIMLAGGTGDQDAQEDVPGVIQKAVWEAGSVTDFCGTGGAAIVDLSGDLTYGAVSSTIAGDFSAATVGMYAYVTGLTSTNDGYFEIEAITADTSVTIATGNIAGTAIDAGDDGDTLAVLVGGACGVGASATVIENANDTIASDIGLSGGYNVDVLYNKSETLDADTAIDTDSDAVGSIRLIGTDINFAAVTDKDDFPIIAGAANKEITFSGSYWDVSCVKFTNSGGFDTAVTFYAKGGILHKCWVVQTSTTSTVGHGIDASDAIISNNYVDIDGSSGTCYAIFGNGACDISGNYVVTKGYGIYGLTNYHHMVISQNIIIGNSIQHGIDINGSDNCEGVVIANNYIYNFTEGINFDDMQDAIGEAGYAAVYNNIIWGDNDGASFGITSNDTETHTIQVFNNFIGYVNTACSLNDKDTVTLTAIPWTNAATGDFTLNDTAGGGALIKGEFLPTDYDLDGTQDNYNQGTIQAEASAGGGRPELRSNNL